MDVIETLKKLVEIPSPSGKEDRLVEYLMATLEDYDPMVLEEDGIKDLVVNPSADVWVVTHLDTIPPKSGFDFDGTYAYGTGVCDTKGSITAILLALEEVDELRLGIALLSDEEENGRGSKLFVKTFEPKKAVVMEPTSLRIANVHYGSLEIIAEFRGVSAHGSTPEFGVNAIELALDAILRLRKAVKRPVKFLIQEIRGGGEEYAVPETCTLRVDFVFPPNVSPLDVKTKVCEVFGEAEIETVEEDEGFVSGEITLLLERALRAAGLRVEYGEMPSWTDAINLRMAGWDVVVFGPGELQYCHTKNERIAVEEIIKAKEVLVALNEILS